MLVLSRKKNESCVVTAGGVEVRCTIVEIGGDKVRLGWHAPSHVIVDREEVHDHKKRLRDVPVAVTRPGQGSPGGFTNASEAADGQK